VDLIDSINPFQKAYEILSHSVDGGILRAIHTDLIARRSPMTEKEAVEIWPDIETFTKENGHHPNPNSPHPKERRMAEALAWLRNKKRKRAQGAQST